MPLCVAAMKIAYGLLKFPQIADSQGYPVAEAHFQLMIGTDDEAAKQLNLAIKMAEREVQPKKGRSESSGGGYGRGGGRGGRGGRQGYNHSSQGGSWQGTDAYVYPQPPMYPPAQMQAAPPSWPYAAPSGPGPAQFVKGLGGPPHPSATKASKSCFSCGMLGHYSAECPYGHGKGGPPTGM